MSLEGLYSAQFSSPIGQGRGIVFVKNGHFWGGDAIVTYSGRYHHRNEGVAAVLNAICQRTRHSSVLRIEDGSFPMKGRWRDSKLILTGKASGMDFNAELTKISP